MTFAAAKAKRLKPSRGAACAAAILLATAAQAQTPSASPNRPGAANPRTAPATPNPPPVVLSPQINVPPAPPPTINVQPATPAITVEPAVAPPDPTKWVAVAIAVISAGVGFLSARIAYRNQEIGFRKDAAAIVRDIAAKRANAVIQAFENNVARPIGMVLDQVERLINDMAKLTPVEAAQRSDAESRYAALLAAENRNLLRLCSEADGALPRGRPAVFAAASGRAAIDVTLYLAGAYLLSGANQPAPGGANPFDEAMTKIAELKIELRHLLESERIEQIRLTIGDIRNDPYYGELQRWLGRDFVDRLL